MTRHISLSFSCLHRVQKALEFGLGRGPGERREPPDGKPAEHRLDAFPPGLLHPAGLLLLQLLDARLVVPDRLDLGAEHHRGEDGEEQRLEGEEQEEHRRRRGTVRGALLPVVTDAD